MSFGIEDFFAFCRTSACAIAINSVVLLFNYNKSVFMTVCNLFSNFSSPNVRKERMGYPLFSVKINYSFSRCASPWLQSKTPAITKHL